MSIYRHVPCPPLRRYIDFFWYYVDFYPDHDREHVLPDGTFELVINLQNVPRKLFDHTDLEQHVSFKRGWLSGTQSEYLVIDALQGSSMIGAHFKPGGAAPFLGLPAGEVRGRVVELDAIWGNNVWHWQDELLEAPGPQQKFQVLEKLLLWRMRKSGHNPSCRGLDWALENFQRDPHQKNIHAISRKLGMSHKHFIELFRREVGLTPKLFCRIRRFQEVLTRIHLKKRVDWAEVACACGYFDQAHFCNDFFAFAGLNPSAYLDHQMAGDPNFIRAVA